MVTNVGPAQPRSGLAAEVAQLYVTFPPGAGEPPMQLRGFRKVRLNAGESAALRFVLTDRDVSVWDAGAHRWRQQSGTFHVAVGASVADIRLQAVLLN